MSNDSKMSDTADGYWETAEQRGYEPDREAKPGEKTCSYCPNRAGLLAWDDDLGELDVCFSHSGLSQWRPSREYGFQSDEWGEGAPDSHVREMQSREAVEVAVRMSPRSRRPMQRLNGGPWEPIPAS